jgi:SAM-dependent methyltransferase
MTRSIHPQTLDPRPMNRDRERGVSAARRPAIDHPATERLESCPLCDHQAHKPLPIPGRWIGPEVFASLRGRIGLVQCRGCGLVFTNPRPSNGTLCEFYSGSTYACHDTSNVAAEAAKARFVLERIERHLPSGGKRVLLDYGAGGGGFLLQARSRGWEVQGFEPGRRGLETCRGAGLSVASELGMLRDGAFGVLTMHHVLEHLADPAGALYEARRLLAPGGRLYVEVPNARSLRARMAVPFLSRACGVDERYRAFPIHLVYYTAGTLRAMLKKSGWSVESAFTSGLGLDELRIRTDSTAQPPRLSPVAGPGRPAGVRLIRRRLRDAFLNLGLGENLALIARPGP